ncbi:hypothetical protein RN001_014477 [Aquatica leii]|uniref:Phospholipase A2 n=1 Tax=Aquatica leii TaxID=1421715 RepID=A0AAN7QBP7_9COLE|nr:hypothetical protein RN001_014477 [Aquatica leii]
MKFAIIQVLMPAMVAARMVFLNNENESDYERAGSWQIIYPGTKWCGAGNVAQNENDFGPEIEADRCCKAHDLCDDYIEAGGTKHNLTNSAFYTRLKCQCDEDFNACLKKGNTRASNQVGYLYFNALGTQCFREDYPVISCVRYTITPKRKCLEYEYDTTKEKIYQWFDVQIY